MAANANEPFPFFELPPELREMVYDYLSADEMKIAEPETEASLSILDAPLTEMLLVNREMRNEYRKVAKKKIHLVFSDHENFNFTMLPISIRLLNITRVSVRNFIVCEDRCPMEQYRCEAASDLQQTVDFIQKIKTAIPHMTSLEINLGLWCRDDAKCAWPNIPHREDTVEILYKLTEIPGLSCVNVYRSDQRCLEPEKLVRADKLLASWTKADGWSG